MLAFERWQLRAEEESVVVLVLESVGDLASSQSEITAVRIAGLRRASAPCRAHWRARLR